MKSLSVTIDGKRFDDIEAGLSQIEKQFDDAAEAITPQVGRALLDSLRKVAAEMAKTHRTPWSPGPSPDGSLRRRTGAGLRSIIDSVRVSVSGDSADGEIGAAWPMAMHEEGGEIRATRSKYLTIPLPTALNANGTPKKRRARDWDSTFVARSRRGNLLIFRRSGRGIEPLYVLKTSVRIPPRLGLGRAVENMLPYFEGRAFEELSALLDGRA